MRAREIFGLVRDLPAEAMESFFRSLPAEERPLRSFVEEMLASLASAGDFLRDATIPRELTGTGPGTRVGPYVIREVIGEGGFGTVYSADQEHPVRRRVAFKIIKLGMDTRQVIARFEAERQALALLDHPGIAKVLDAGATPEGRPYFVMELVRGQAMTRYCDDQRLPVRERLELFRGVCEAVQHAHQRGIIHRDIKPGNILVAPSDVDGGRAVAKIIDFGIAKAINDPLTDRTLLTEQRQLVGTPEYMSPEQANGANADIDTRTDVYSLGVLLYELLTGVTPLDPQTLRSAEFARMQQLITETDPPKPSTRVRTLGDAEGPAGCEAPALTDVARRRRTDGRGLVAGLRGELDWIVMRAMEKDRARRYPTALSLSEDIHRHLTHQPVQAGPPSRVYRLGRTIRRHRTAFGAGAAVLAALVLGLVAAVTGFVSARRERDAAQQLAYVATLYAAAQAIEKSDGAGARRSLDLAPERLRGWEWRHLDHRSDTSLATFHLFGPGELRVWVHPDGGRAIVHQTAHDPALVDLRTGATVRSFAATPGDGAYATPSPDLDLLLVGAPGAALCVYSVEDGTALWTHPAGMDAVAGAFSRDGATLAAFDAGTKEFVLLDSRTGAERARLAPTPTPRSPPRYAEQGRLLRYPVGAPGAREFVAELNPATGESSTTYHTSSRDFNRFSFSLGASTAELMLKDYASPSTPLTLACNSTLITDVDVSRDSSAIALGETTGSIQVWRKGDDGRHALATRLLGHTRLVTSLEFTRDGSRLVSADAGGTLKVWETGAGADIPAWRRDRNTFAEAISPDARWTVGGAWGYVMLSDARTGIRAWSRSISRAYVVAAAFDPTGSSVVCADKASGSSSMLSVFETATGALRRPAFEAPGLVSSLVCIDAARALVATTDRRLRVIDLETGAAIVEAVSPSGCVRQARVSPDGALAFTSTGVQHRDVIELDAQVSDETPFVDVWRLPELTRAARLGPHPSPVTALAFDNGTRTVLAGCADGSVHAWESDDAGRWGRRWSAAAAGEEISALAASARIGRVAACVESRVTILDFRSGSVLIQLGIAPGAPRAAAFSADASALVLTTPSHDFQLLESGQPAAGSERRAEALAAGRLVDRLFRRHTLARDVVEQLRSGNGADHVPPRVRETALAIASSRSDAANYLNSDAMSLGMDRATAGAQALHAARIMESVCRDHPTIQAFHNTLALVYYRAGLDREAIGAIEKSVELRAAQALPVHPSDLLISVLAKRRLEGTFDDALFDLALTEIDRQSLRGDYEIDNLLAEAEQARRAVNETTGGSDVNNP